MLFLDELLHLLQKNGEQRNARGIIQKRLAFQQGPQLLRATICAVSTGSDLQQSASDVGQGDSLCHDQEHDRADCQLPAAGRANIFQPHKVAILLPPRRLRQASARSSGGQQAHLSSWWR